MKTMTTMNLIRLSEMLFCCFSFIFGTAVFISAHIIFYVSQVILKNMLRRIVWKKVLNNVNCLQLYGFLK